jgi:hypothetical protein
MELPKYHLGDWIPDWNFVLGQTSAATSDEARSAAVKSHFLSRYHSREEARWRCDRVLAAVRYLQVNGPTFEKEGWVLTSSKGSNITEYMASALYRFFAIATAEGLQHPPQPQAFMAAAREHEGFERDLR